MADAFGEPGKEASGSSARPIHTIEGEAVEITPEPATDSAEEAAKAFGEEAGSSPAADEDADMAQPEPALQPRRGASIFELKSFMTHLAAGFVGGLVGIAILAFAWHKFPGQSSAVGPETAALKQRIDRLESMPGPNPQALAALDQRVKALETTKDSASPQLSGLNERVGRLEDSLKTLAETAKNGGSVADAAVIDNRVSALEQKLQSTLQSDMATNSQELASLKRELGDLRTKITALGQTAQGDAGADLGSQLNGLSDRIAKLEASLPKLADALKAETAESKSATASLAFTNLKAAVASGRPYAAELASLKASAPPAGDLGVLPRFAETGIPTLPQLIASFRKLKDQILSASTADADQTLLGGLVASAKTLVKVRRVDANAQGTDDDAVLARAEAKLDEGDLSGGTAEVENLSGASKQAFAAWLDQAHARLSADATLQQIGAALAEGEQAKRQTQP